MGGSGVKVSYIKVCANGLLEMKSESDASAALPAAADPLATIKSHRMAGSASLSVAPWQSSPVDPACYCCCVVARMLPSDLVLDALSLLSACVSYLAICTSQSKRVPWPSHHSNTTFGSSHTWGEFKRATGRKIDMCLIPQLRLGQVEAEVMAVPQGGATGCHHCSPLAFSGVV